jgi:hypothetical protein
MSQASHQLINQTSGNVEYYTPLEIVEAARRVMGGIDLDPASSDAANERIKAAHIYTSKESGLAQPWHGRIWLNHPFHAGWNACDEGCQRKTCEKRGHVYHDIPSNADWINYLAQEFEAGRVTQSCNITFAATSENWFQPLLRQPQCFLSPRTNYYLPDGSILKGVSKGSVVTYYGNNVKGFAEEFSKFGKVKVLYL